MNLGLRDGKIAQVPLRFGFFWPALHQCHLNFVSKEHLWPGTDAHSNQLSYTEGLLKACKSVPQYPRTGRELAGHGEGVKKTPKSLFSVTSPLTPASFGATVPFSCFCCQTDCFYIFMASLLLSLNVASDYCGDHSGPFFTIIYLIQPFSSHSKFLGHGHWISVSVVTKCGWPDLGELGQNQTDRTQGCPSQRCGLNRFLKKGGESMVS